MNSHNYDNGNNNGNSNIINQSQTFTEIREGSLESQSSNSNNHSDKNNGGYNSPSLIRNECGDKSGLEGFMEQMSFRNL